MFLSLKLPIKSIAVGGIKNAAARVLIRRAVVGEHLCDLKTGGGSEKHCSGWMQSQISLMGNGLCRAVTTTSWTQGRLCNACRGDQRRQQPSQSLELRAGTVQQLIEVAMVQ